MYSRARIIATPLISELAYSITGQVYPAFNFDGYRLPSVVTYTRSTTGSYKASGGLLATAAINTPRYEYNLVTGAYLGLLHEGARTNLTTRNQEFDNAAWNKVSTTVSANSAVAPDGTTTMDKLVEVAATAQHAVIRGSADAVTANTFYTLSSYLSAAGRTTARLMLTNGGFANSFYNDFDISAGTEGSSGTVGTGTFTDASIENCGSSIFRPQISGKIDAASTTAQTAIYLNNGASYLGDITKGINAWSPQLEAGKFASSSIPTVGSTVSRAEDSAYITGVNFTSAFGTASQGTISVGFDFIGLDGVQTVYSIGNNTGSNNIHLYAFNGTLYSVVTVSGSNVSVINLGTMVAGNTYDVCVAWDSNGISAYLAGGGGVQSSGSITIPTCSRIGLGNSDTGGNELFGHLKYFRYYRTKFNNSNLVNLAENPASWATIVAPSGGSYTSVSAATTAMSDKTTYGSQAIYAKAGSYTESAAIVLDAFTSLVGAGSSQTICNFDQGAGASSGDVAANSCFDNFKTSHVKGIAFHTTNGRYGCHFQQVADGAHQIMEDCIFYHHGNVAAGWDYQFAMAAGTYDNSSQKIYRCVAYSPYGGFSSHNKDGTHTVGTEIYLEECQDLSVPSGNKWGYRYEHICGTGAGSSGSTYKLHNCSTLNGFLYVIRSAATRVANAAAALAYPLTTTITITGNNNNVPYVGNANNTGAYFKEKAISIRYGYNGTAATLNINSGTTGTDAKPLIFGTTTAYNLGYGNYSFVHGSLDISGQYTPLDASNTNLASRLGNCATTPKSFRIDATNVPLTTNYTGMTNAQVITSIQGVLDGIFGAGNVVIEEYSVMDNWRPSIANYTEDYTCGASESVVPSQLVTMPDGRLAVGWEYISAGATGKVLTGGKVSQFTANSAARTALEAVGANTDLIVVAI